MKQINKKRLNVCLVATLTVAMLSVFVMPSRALTFEWTSNSSLIKSQDKWDCRLWHWNIGFLEPAEPDEYNYCNWTADGTVKLRVEDSPWDLFFTAANLDQGTERLSLPASYQPPLLNLASVDSVILEADVENCHGSSLVVAPDFIGIKFDAWAVVNQNEGSTKLMTELYFIRAGLNLAWIREYARKTDKNSDVWNYLVALDHPDFYGIYANETKYGTDSAKWSIDLKYFIKRGANAHNITFNELYLSKVSFTLEAGGYLDYNACWGTIHMLKVTYDYSGGGGCPFVSTWNGSHYVLDNNILPAAEMSNGADVEDYYRLEQTLVPTYKGKLFSSYSLQISEFENDHSYLDQVKLLAVDHSSDVNVAVTPYGEILTYGNPASPVSAVDEDGIDVLSQLSSIDENYYQGCNGSHITLTFAPTDVSNGVKLVIREDTATGPPLLKCPVYVQVLNATEDWNTVATFYTRTYWATNIINLTGCLPDAEGNLKVRLCFVSNDKIDYVGLDITPQASVEAHEANLISAIHSTQGNVRLLLMENDQTYAELILGEQIQLTFRLPNNQNQKRTFILYTEGHYTTPP